MPAACNIRKNVSSTMQVNTAAVIISETTKMLIYIPIPTKVVFSFVTIMVCGKTTWWAVDDFLCLNSSFVNIFLLSTLTYTNQIKTSI